eukprot:m.226535 g.226535  ORF g.226535 m.226535 type:complete len:247 (-) comp18800_c0_seq1:149-889(-)
MARSAVAVYSALVATILGAAVVSGTRPITVVKYTSVVFLVMSAIYLGYAPVFVKSLFARVMHLPPDMIFFLTNGRPFNFDKVTDQVLVGRLPRSSADLDQLAKENVGAIVKMTEAWENILTDREVLSRFEQKTLPTPDYAAPDLPSVQVAVDYVIDCLRRGKVVYVHCNGGRGRSVVVVIAWLMKTRGWSREKAFAFVQSKRRIAVLSKPIGRVPGLPACMLLAPVFHSTWFCFEIDLSPSSLSLS